MLVAAFVEELFALVLRHSRLGRNAKLAYGHAEWQAGSTLQLQRIAHESLGLGNWTRTDETIPLTELGDTLGVLDISNSNHARLVQPRAGINTMGTDDRVSGAQAKFQYLRLPSK